MHRSEILAIVAVVGIVLVLVAWVWISRYRRRRAEKPRLRLSDLKLPVDDWRLMVPPEWRTEGTNRLWYERTGVR